jgi:hypothetical protein
MSVTPVIGTNVVVATGGTAVIVFPAGITGGYIVNPFDATEPLYVNPVGDAVVGGTGATFALQPGQTWYAIEGQSTPTTVNAATSAHAFSAVYWL